MRRLFKFKYPKIALLALAIILAYYIFSRESVANIMQNLSYSSYVIAFIAGILFTFGFTMPFAIGFFLTLQPDNIFIAAIIGGFGALIGDNIIFSLIKFSFLDEFKRLEKTSIFKEIDMIINKNLNERIKLYLLYIFSGFVIASPLPDEIGVTMLAGMTRIKHSIFNIISFILNTAGILIILSIAK